MAPKGYAVGRERGPCFGWGGKTERYPAMTEEAAQALADAGNKALADAHKKMIEDAGGKWVPVLIGEVDFVERPPESPAES